MKLQTKHEVDHYLEACSREERDEWAADITAAVNNLQTTNGKSKTDKPDPAGSQLNNISLR